MEWIFPIGKTSADETVGVDFAQLPHLFLSYAEEAQARQFCSGLARQLHRVQQGTHVSLALALTRPGLEKVFRRPGTIPPVFSYLRHDAAASTESSRVQFFRTLHREMRRRQSRLHKEASGVRLRTLPYPPMLVVLDEVFDILQAPQKSVAMTFLHLLHSGRELGMHVLAVSAVSYHNLVRQLVQVSPRLKQKFRPASGIGTGAALGAELVISGDDLLFFRPAGAPDYQRLYPLQEGLREVEDSSAQERMRQYIAQAEQSGQLAEQRSRYLLQ
ncbi:MAG TPA: hypothetical protein VHK69_10615 [Chitinophagaceae bacterium]|jgi:hypothetical protein|nr:hypothetical protein [Chitinophagaceae bacterium]